jgi:CRISPR-associated protein Csb1
MPKLKFETLKNAISKNAAALRCRKRLQPAGGQGDKVFPPTYEGGKYAAEKRFIDGKERPCVLLDSVQSQANRMEMSLLAAARSNKISLPIVQVDFNKAEPPIQEVGTITSLEAPHRIADAILRDSMNKDCKFRDTEEGKAFTNASAQNATALLRFCPTALLFGMWDSTGPKGGAGVKFQRALVSELIGVEAIPGVRSSSRLDPLQIQLNAGPLYALNEGGWTLDEAEAKKEKGKAVKLGKDGKPSEANHGNVTPTLEQDHGGVTIDYALQITVISLPALRRLNFPVDGQLKNTEAQTVLAALGLCAAILSIEQGCDLRSRCLLVPDTADTAVWEIVNGDGSTESFSLSGDEACELLRVAVTAAETAGLPWMKTPLTLTPSKALAELVRRSCALTRQSTGGGE